MKGTNRIRAQMREACESFQPIFGYFNKEEELLRLIYSHPVVAAKG
jgi:hypothetical protein